MNMAKEAAALRDYMVTLRRDFHQHPELGWKETRSQGIICGELDRLGIPWERAANTGVIGYLGPKEGPVVGLRADMDALPMTEETGLPFASCNPGMMHACGHDAHMAAMLGVANILNRAELKCPVRLIFQPAEEGMNGGAVLAKVPQLQGMAAVGAVHVWAALPVGTINVEPGPRMARAAMFEIEIIGRGAHASMPHLAVDAPYIASLFVNAAQAIVSRQTDPLEPAVLSVSTINAGTAPNVLPPTAKLTGTLRCFSNPVGDAMEASLQHVLQHITAAFGAEGRFSIGGGVPPVINDERCAAVARRCAAAVVGEENLMGMKPTTGGEDFAYFLKHAPGMLAFVGAGNPEKGMDKPHHHPAFDIDEDCLVNTAAFLAEYAVKMGEELRNG